MNVSRNNNLLTVAGSLSNSVTSLTVNGQTATVYHDLTWAVPGGITLTSGLNRLTAVVTAGGLTMTNSLLEDLPATVALRYDTDGNLTWDGLLAYTYDCADELTAVTLTNGWKTGYVYDGLGRRRIRKDYTWSAGAWAETNEVHYVYDGMNVIQERNSNNIPLVTYTRGVDLSGTRQGAGGIGGLLARTDANGPAYYHDDGNGNVTALVNGSGALVAKYLYDSFGNTLGMWGSLAAGNTYRFSSKEMDARTGQYYYGYRWYDPNLQRWLNRDPIQEAGGINLYGFVGNDPINEVDLYGLAGADDDLEPEGEITREILRDLRFDQNGRYRSDAEIENIENQIDENTEKENEKFEQNLPYTGTEPIMRALVPKGKDNCPPKGGVYVLVNPDSKIIMRSGQTGNLKTRESRHGRNPRFKDYDFETVYRTDDYSERRGLEQTIHIRATAAQGFPPPFNYNQPIAAGNPNYINYMNSAQAYMKNLQ